MASKMDDFFEAAKRAARMSAEEILVNVVKLGTVDAGYTTGRPRVKFDGETTTSSRQYPYVNAVAANDRVLMVRAGHTWVVVGKIN